MNNPEAEVGEQPFAEFWMGDHTNGPSKVLIDKEDENLVSLIDDAKFIEDNAGQEVVVNRLFELNGAKFLGKAYLDEFAEKDEKLKTSLSYLFKVLSVRTALSI